MRIAVTMSYTPNWSELAAISVPNMAKYCTKHGYSLFVTVDEYKKYNGIYKFNNILKLLDGDYDIVYSFDVDTLITNHSIKLEKFVEESKYVYVCKGLNMGVFGIKNTTEGCDFAEDCRREIVRNKYNCEQDYILDMVNVTKPEIFEHPAFNSYLSQLYPEVQQPVTKEQGQWEQGCFVLHLPALPLEQRINLMKEYSQYIVL